MKTIMIKDNVYADLSKIKDGKSFSELLEELVNYPQKEKKKLIKGIAGILSNKEAERAIKKTRALRNSTKARVYDATS